MNRYFVRWIARIVATTSVFAGLGFIYPAFARPDLVATPSVVGGDSTRTCGWPSAVYLDNGCSGSLIHPRLIITAAHCNDNATSVFIGEHSPWARQVPLQRCVDHPDYLTKGAGAGVDYAYCFLSEDVLDVPITPPLAACEAEVIEAGTPATLVGFGATSAGDSQSIGTKREVSVSIEKVFDNGEISVGGNGQGACNGDSGGPLYVRMPAHLDHHESWRLLGIASSGSKNCDGQTRYGTIVDEDAWRWIENDSGIDFTPCVDNSGNWNPSSECGHFPVSPQSAGPHLWEQGCGTELQRSGFSYSCGIPYDETPPQLRVLSPLPNTTVFEDDNGHVELELADDSGIAYTDLYLNAQLYATLEGQESDIALTGIAEGQYHLTVITVDRSGKTATLTGIPFHFIPSESTESEDSDDDGNSNKETDEDDDDNGDDDADEETDSADDEDENDESPHLSDEDSEDKGDHQSDAAAGGCRIDPRSPGPSIFLSFAALSFAFGRRRHAGRGSSTRNGARK